MILFCWWKAEMNSYVVVLADLSSAPWYSTGEYDLHCVGIAMYWDCALQSIVKSSTDSPCHRQQLFAFMWWLQVQMTPLTAQEWAHSAGCQDTRHEWYDVLCLVTCQLLIGRLKSFSVVLQLWTGMQHLQYAVNDTQHQGASHRHGQCSLHFNRIKTVLFE